METFFKLKVNDNTEPTLNPDEPKLSAKRDSINYW